MNKAHFTKLFSPISIGGITLKNRLVMAPMGVNFAEEAGHFGERAINYYEQRARGGVGMIIVEATAVGFPSGARSAHNHALIHDDRFIPGLINLTSAIKRHGCRAAIQLIHVGRETKLDPVAPSPIPGNIGVMPKELETAEIRNIVALFARAAERAKRSGFDGAEIHGAHHYLIAQFLSRFSNKRHDQYGGSLENRTRLLIEVLRAVREAVGERFPVWPRINSLEFGLPEGITLEEAKGIAKIAETGGADAVHISAWGLFDRDQPGYIMPMAQEIKKVIQVPLIAAGKIVVELAEKSLAEGKLDLVAMGRALITDPELPRKAAEDRLDEIRPCIACSTCADRRGFYDLDMKCRVNPCTGREAEYSVTPAERSKRVLVIGAGPAGMEAARIAALRGHKVTLWERSKRLGGQLLVAAIPPRKHYIADLNKYYEIEIKRLGIQVVLGKEATLEAVEAISPDAVVVASGSRHRYLDVPINDYAQVATASQVLSGECATGETVVVIGGGMVGLETAEFLAEKGKKVTVLEVLEELGGDMGPTVKPVVLERLKSKGVRLETGVAVQEIRARSVKVSLRGKEENIEANDVVLAIGMYANDEIVTALEGRVSLMYAVGDCLQPRTIMEAIEEGLQVGLKI